MLCSCTQWKLSVSSPCQFEQPNRVLLLLNSSSVWIALGEEYFRCITMWSLGVYVAADWVVKLQLLICKINWWLISTNVRSKVSLICGLENWRNIVFFKKKYLQGKEKSSTSSQEQDSLLAEMVLLQQLEKKKTLIITLHSSTCLKRAFHIISHKV